MSSFNLSGYLLVGPNSSNQTAGDTSALLSNQDLVNKLIQDKKNILMVEEDEKFLKAEAERRGISGGDFPSFDYMPFVIILLISLVICIFVIALGNAFPFIPSSVITLLCLIVIAIGAMLSFREYTLYAAYKVDATTRMNQDYLDKTNSTQCVGPLCCSDASGTVWDPIKSICVVKPSTVSSTNATPISSAYNPKQSGSTSVVTGRDANQLLSVFAGQLNSGSNYIPGGNQPLSEEQRNAQSTLLSGILSYLNKDASVGTGAPPSTATSTNVENTPTPSSTPSAQPVGNTPSQSADSGPVSSVYGGDAAVLYNSVPYTANGSFLFNGKMITDPEITSRYYLNDDDGFKYSIVDYNMVNNIVSVSVIFPDPAHKGYTVRRDNLYCSFSNCGKKITNVLYRTFNKETPYVQSAADAQSAAMTTAYNSNTGLVSSYTGMGSDGSSTSNENYYYTYNGKNYTMSSITQMVPFMIGTVLVDDIVNSGYTVLLSSVTPVMKKTVGSQYKYINVSKPFSSSVGAGSGSSSGPSTMAANTQVTGPSYGSGSGSGLFPVSSSSVVTYSGSGSGSMYGSGSWYGSGSVYGSGSGLVPKLSANTFYQFEANSSTISCSPTGCWWAESKNPNFYLSISSSIKTTQSILNQTYLNNKPSFIFTGPASLYSDSFPSSTASIINFTCFFVINIDSVPTGTNYNNILSFGNGAASTKLLQIKLNNSGITSNINSASSSSISVTAKTPFILMVNFYQNIKYSLVVIRANGKITTQFINLATSVDTTKIDIGSCRVDTITELKPFSGGISEFLFYDTATNPFTDSYISQVENYLSTKWNIPIQQISSTGSGSVPRIIPDPTVLFKPSAPSVSSVSNAADNIVLTITPATSTVPVTGYTAFYTVTQQSYTADEIIKNSTSINITTTTTTTTTTPLTKNITNLNDNTDYFIYVVAYNAVGSSGVATTTAKTMQKPKPEILTPYLYSISARKEGDGCGYKANIVITVNGTNLTHCEVWASGGANGPSPDCYNNEFIDNRYNWSNNGPWDNDTDRGRRGMFPVINNTVTLTGAFNRPSDKFTIYVRGYNDTSKLYTDRTSGHEIYTRYTEGV